ncbi:hypothetical protein E3N88_28303 [Mikania micrantha]|uniref:Uncharacterized protein n=1 Tax=Mikania micrantha TaxID=192012 RepID=A0A5N6N234_9ASTR|nr:hypothetical protein E3N88_28303 [Mikania micrantha]
MKSKCSSVVDLGRLVCQGTWMWYKRWIKLGENGTSECAGDDISEKEFSESHVNYCRGRWRRLSVAQFATRMGLYTEGELASKVFDGLHDFEDEIEKAMFWAEVVEGVYVPDERSLQNFATHVIGSFIGFWRRATFVEAHISSSWQTLLTEENIANFTHVCNTSPLDMRTLRYMQIVEQTPVGMRLRGRDGRIWDPVPEEQEDDEEEHYEEPVHEEDAPFGTGIRGFDYRNPPHGEYFNFDPVQGPDPPSNMDLWHRFAGLQAEQNRQYDLLHQIQDVQRQSFEWLFASHQSAATFHQFDVSEPPRFDYGYSAGGSQKRSRGGHDGEASGSGPRDDEED